MLTIVDTSNVTDFPLANLNDFPAMLETLASDIREGRHGTPQSGVFVLANEEGLTLFGWGTSELYANVGMLEAAKHMMIAGEYE